MKTLKGETYKSRLLLNYLNDPESIRAAAAIVFDLAEKGQLRHFNYHPENLEIVADFVIAVLLRQYPSLEIPIHSRWRHFEVGGVDRLAILKEKVSDPLELLKSSVELAIVSVLLDAGAGAKWQYTDYLANVVLNKSEGIAAASFNLFMQGFFSSDLSHQFQADAKGLLAIDTAAFAAALEISQKNSLAGFEGRIGLLQSLAACVQQQTTYFLDSSNSPRVGSIVAYLLGHVKDQQLSMKFIFETMLDSLCDIWPGRYEIDGVNLGDVWPYSATATELNPHGFIPFHKLTQWLCYSLIEPFEHYGITIVDVDTLSGLAEYRNGGLMIDLHLLTPINSDALKKKYSLGSELVVEWRALTVVLLDQIADLIRIKLGFTAEQLPLIKILQGGTWKAGRLAAMQQRKDGSPPILLDSDGTVL